MKRALISGLLPLLLFAQVPDRGGYRWLDSDSAGGPQFQWVDISSVGTRIALGDDDNTGPFPLGFGFGYYGVTRDSVRVCSNGWLSFVSQSHQFHHFPVPDRQDPNSLLAPLWADLDPAQGGSALYWSDTAQARFIVSWVGVPFHGSSDSCTFQVVLHGNGDVRFQYLDIPDVVPAHVDSCSVGIENDSGSTGVGYLYDGQPAIRRLHDSLAVRFFRLDHDVLPAAVLRPGAQVLTGDSIRPLVRVWNAGLSPASSPVRLRIGTGYSSDTAIAGLAPLRDTFIEFPAWVAEADTTELEVVTVLSGDEWPANDTLRMSVAGSYVGEVGYDDGSADTWFLKNGSPTNDWAAVVRFSIPYGRYRLRGARLYVGDTLRFRQVLVCPDSAGTPQLGSPFCVFDSAGAPYPETWLDVGADTFIESSSDVWLVAFWFRRATGPVIGEDRSLPIDGRTSFGSPAVRWLPYATGDILARLRIDGRSGIEELPAQSGGRVLVGPNPFRGSIVLRCSGATSMRVRDVAGRVVRVLQPSAEGSVAWDGKDNYGLRLPAGAYFLETRAAGTSFALRLVMLD